VLFWQFVEWKEQEGKDFFRGRKINMSRNILYDYCDDDDEDEDVNLLSFSWLCTMLFVGLADP